MMYRRWRLERADAFHELHQHCDRQTATTTSCNSPSPIHSSSHSSIHLPYICYRNSDTIAAHHG